MLITAGLLVLAIDFVNLLLSDLVSFYDFFALPSPLKSLSAALIY
jgi:hypothetical protein